MGIHFVATGGCSGFSYKQLYTAKALRQTQGANTAGDWDVEEERGQRGLGRVGAGQEEKRFWKRKQFLYGVVGGLPIGHMNFLEIHFLSN